MQHGEEPGAKSRAEDDMTERKAKKACQKLSPGT